MKNRKKATCVLPECDSLLELMALAKRPLALDEIARLARLPGKSRKSLLACLRQLEDEGKLVRPARNAWLPTSALQTVEGRFQSLLNGGGFVKAPGEGSEEFFIHPDNVNGAWHNDLVRIAILPESLSTGKNRRGKVLSVLERELKNIPVRLEKREGRTLLCRPADKRLHFMVSVAFPKGAEMPAGMKAGQLLLVAPGEHLAANLYEARLEEVLGREDDVTVQEDLVKLNQNVPREFPALALEQAAALPDMPVPEDEAGREDMSGVPFVTIDGADARDFDDAIHVERHGDGWLLRVAIADVAHYVRPDGLADGLDAEAMRRGNSWYFPTSVEPMLPKALSNGLCSLAPLKKRLAVLVEIPFDKVGAPGAPRFAEIVMQSWGRLVYDSVGGFFASGQFSTNEGNILRDPETVRAMLGEAHQLYKVLAKARKERGTLDFDLPEPRYSFDAQGKVTGVGIADRNDAHRLVEEFMIAANEAVARHLGNTGLPFLYRDHPAPEAAKLAQLFDTLEATSVESMPPGIQRDSAPDAVQKILSRARGTPAEYVVNKLCLRAMPQARYQAENTGHFGLASTAYCHFTSPIRRYADLLVHRTLKVAMGKSREILPNREKLDEIASGLNTLERRAMDCEREMGRRMGCLLLRGHEGEVFDATVSGVTDFGIFVELASMPLEGIIRLDDLVYDWFSLDSRAQRLIGQKSGQVWELGMPARVRLEAVDLGRLELRFVPEKSAKSSKLKGRNKGAPRKKYCKGSPGETKSDNRHGAGEGKRGPGRSRGAGEGKRGSDGRRGKATEGVRKRGRTR